MAIVVVGRGGELSDAQNQERYYFAKSLERRGHDVKFIPFSWPRANIVVDGRRIHFAESPLDGRMIVGHNEDICLLSDTISADYLKRRRIADTYFAMAEARQVKTLPFTPPYISTNLCIIGEKKTAIASEEILVKNPALSRYLHKHRLDLIVLSDNSHMQCDALVIHGFSRVELYTSKHVGVDEFRALRNKDIDVYTVDFDANTLSHGGVGSAAVEIPAQFRRWDWFSMERKSE